MKRMLPVIFIVLFCSFLINSAAFSSMGSPVVISYAGDVKVFPAGKTDPILCNPGMVIDEGTVIVTGSESYLEIAFDNSKENIVKVKENSEVVIKLDDSETIELIDGKVFTFLKEIGKGETFRIKTPSAVCGARGTGWMTYSSGLFTEVAVFDSSVFVRGLNKDGSVMEEEFWVETGFERRTERFKSPGEPKKMSREKLEEMKKEFISDSQTREDIAKKLQNLSKKDEKKQERIESIIDRKTESRLDKLKEEKEDDQSDRYREVGP